MTLKRQLIIMVCAIFAVMFVGTLLISIHNSYKFIGAQLSSHAQDTATSLGLSLSQVVADGDDATLGRMVDAIFDSGYYQNIRVDHIDGSTILDRELAVQVYGVPNWFIKLVPLNTPIKTAHIMDGWQRAGVVKVSSNPGYAYADLWASTKHSFIWFLVSALVSLGIGIIILHYILKPLQAIIGQAEAICARQFPVQKELPWTDDLRKVVVAMNRLAEKLKQMFADEAARTEKFREEAYKDTVTNLGNRRYMGQQLQHVLLGGRDYLGGAFMHVEIHDFKTYNDKWGFEAGDLLLCQVAATLQQITGNINDSTVAKMQGGAFGVLLPNVDKEQLEPIMEELSSAFTSYRDQGITEITDVAHLGATVFVRSDNASDVLANADMALRQAQQQGMNAWKIYEAQQGEATEILSATEWGNLIRDAITRKSAFMMYQQVHLLDIDNEEPFYHYEALIRLKDEKDKILAAAQFWPMAERLHLTAELDRLAVELVFADMAKQPQANFAINLSVASIIQPEFTAWLLEKLGTFKHAMQKIFFEVHEYALINHIDEVTKFAEALTEVNAEFAIDHFGSKFYSFSYLHHLQVAYLKIDGSFIRGIHEDDDNKFYVESLCKMAHGIDVLVIAETVETQDELNTLVELGVDGIQGYLLGKPEKL